MATCVKVFNLSFSATATCMTPIDRNNRRERVTHLGSQIIMAKTALKNVANKDILVRVNAFNHKHVETVMPGCNLSMVNFKEMEDQIIKNHSTHLYGTYWDVVEAETDYTIKAVAADPQSEHRMVFMLDGSDYRTVQMFGHDTAFVGEISRIIAKVTALVQTSNVQVMFIMSGMYDVDVTCIESIPRVNTVVMNGFTVPELARAETALKRWLVNV